MATDFRDLRVWEDAMALVEAVYGIAAGFPVDERFGLTAQIKRAAVSVPSCIAEGNARASTLDYLRFLSMAAGSMAEVQTQMLLALRLGFVGEFAADAFLVQHRNVSMQLQALRKALQRRSTDVLAHSASRFPDPCSRP